ncbi:sulfate adenylyltransferase/adenylylsulfate kinase [Gregarina niphandrodes]|uniref:adenylyl-sulfate kinase n=1 Tax=Gregarina niphandrodes TaxID=110365 RepID=A0A023B4T5_GRENI|nr:sulfate adenylyltransferase/adenylylsulfate kinase [Gregarina niphandrodes]EZG57606.1 sulfate adenylyltransferase/adenylylsulfate kinase [Gregarina niphandrodes]|eukprot:XP_011131049.1 sulfate adenylyltransferase/adenylylsulfate kinase [Gregarina niphandrodes]
MFTHELPVLTELMGQVSLPSDVVLGDRGLCDLELLLNGGFAPLNRFMTLKDYGSVMENMTLEDGTTVFPLPVVLPVSADLCQPISGDAQNGGGAQSGAVVHIRNDTNALLADLEVTSIFVPDLDKECRLVLNEQFPTSPTHPYAIYLKKLHQNCFYVGGRLVEKHPIVHFDYSRYRLTPTQARERLAERGWAGSTVGFQTRNPMHRSHYELTVNALRQVEAKLGGRAHLMITPAVGPTQPGDVDYRIRVRCYERILAHYREEPLLVLLPLAMRMAGPREALLHALVRRNYGCSYFIVGRDHAGPSCKTRTGEAFYDPYAAHALLEKHAARIGIEPVFGKMMCYCGPELGYLQQDQVPAVGPDGTAVQVQNISGTEFRRLLQNNASVPEWFCFPDVVDELRLEYKAPYLRGLCIYFTGLPCAGKSTLAQALNALLLESRHDQRKVTVLDADVIRTHLSKGLGFSRDDRSLNVRRIGYVAHEIVKHGGICLVANIAPYKDDRKYNRQLIESGGGTYVEVYVSTPLEVCEKRDIKQLYNKARAGVIKQFTGISDPYEAPDEPDLIINSSNNLAQRVAQVHQYLLEKQLTI